MINAFRSFSIKPLAARFVVIQAFFKVFHNFQKVTVCFLQTIKLKYTPIIILLLHAVTTVSAYASQLKFLPTTNLPLVFSQIKRHITFAVIVVLNFKSP